MAGVFLPQWCWVGQAGLFPGVTMAGTCPASPLALEEESRGQFWAHLQPGATAR